VYRARVTFVICIPFADCQLRDTFRGGKISLLFCLDQISVAHKSASD
jgi:hypothetical protein